MTSPDEQENATMKLAHVLFMDIVSYSTLPTDRQSKILKTLQQVVRGTAEVKRAQAADQIITLATGDGMALVFFNDPMAPVQCALEISKGLKAYPDIKLRMGVHTGPVNEIIDVNERLNVAGAGINMAQRVMDSGDAGHILLSRRVAEDLGQYSSWQPFLHDLKEVEVKHGVRVHVFNLFTGEVGNAALPEKVRKQKKKSIVKPALIATLAVLATVAIGAGLWRAVSSSSVSTTPLKPESEFAALLEKKVNVWTEGAFAAQAPDGGMKAVTSGAQSRTQAWTTAQALTGILERPQGLDTHVPQIRSAFDFIHKLRRTTPFEGWNLYGNNNPFTITEINGWITVAHVKSLESKTQIWNDTERAEMVKRVERDLTEIARRQESSGGFRPIKEEGADFVRTYSTVIALWSFIEARKSGATRDVIGTKFDDNIRRGISWLMQTYKGGQGWVQNPTRTGQKDRFDGLTAQALFVLSQAAAIPDFAYINNDQTYRTARLEFINNSQLPTRSIEKDNSSIPDADVAFHGSEFMAEGSTFLWFPWTLLELTQLVNDKSLSEADRDSAADLRLRILNENGARLENYVETANLTYFLAENLFCVTAYLRANGSQ